MDNCGICGQSLAQVGRGRPRKYCGDACRRAADRERIVVTPLFRVSTCELCRGEIEQPARGRRRKYCPKCAELLSGQAPAVKARRKPRKTPQAHQEVDGGWPEMTGSMEWLEAHDIE